MLWLTALNFWQSKEGTRIGIAVSGNWGCLLNLFWIAITEEMQQRLFYLHFFDSITNQNNIMGENSSTAN